MLNRKTISIVMISGIAALISTSAFADGNWARNHPRRDQVNDRLANQNRRIRQEVREGDLTRNQARALRTNDRSIRRQEVLFAKQDGGHITAAEQKALNQELNKNSRKIGK